MRIFCLLEVLVAISLPGIAAAERVSRFEKVGALGDPHRLIIQGTTVFRPDAVRSGVVWNCDVLVVSHPDAPLCSYLNVLEEKAKEGFRHAGFVEPKVHAEADLKGGRVLLTVEEGQRLNAGEIRVEGAKMVPVAELIHRLTSPHPSADARAKIFDRDDGQQQGQRNANSPGRKAEESKKNGSRQQGGTQQSADQGIEMENAAWEVGKPAKLSIVARKSLQRQIERTLADLGYYLAKLSIEIAPQIDRDCLADDPDR